METDDRNPFLQERKDYKQKFIVYFLIVVVSGIIFGTIGYFLGIKNEENRYGNSFLTSKTQSPTASEKQTPSPDLNPSSAIKGWKTFISPDHDYTFSYPSYWSIDVINKKLVDDQCYPDYSSECKNGNVIGFNVQRDISPISFTQWTKEGQQGSINLPSLIANTTLDGEPAVVEVIYAIAPQAVGETSTSGLYYYVIHNGVGYELSISLNKSLSNNLTINQLPPLKPNILSTFKFLNIAK